jgi:hypothetical protein
MSAMICADVMNRCRATIFRISSSRSVTWKSGSARG